MPGSNPDSQNRVMKLLRIVQVKWWLAVFVSMLAVTAFAASSDTPLKKGAAHAAKAAAPANAYRLKDGDSVEVSVWGEENLRKELKVLPDGSITFPLVGRIDVEGLTTAEIAQKITDGLNDYLESPVVTVVINGIDGNRVYILGNVVKPGPIVLDSPMNVLQALSLAGGLAKFADEDGIQVLRPTANGVKPLSVHYGDLIKAKDLSSNISLEAGDTILVP